MINKKKLTKHIWYQGYKYKVEKVFSPNNYDDFILCSRLIEDHIHMDDKTTPVDMILLDANNDMFYPDTKESRKIINQLNKDKEKINEIENGLNSKLTNMWLGLLKNV